MQRESLSQEKYALFAQSDDSLTSLCKCNNLFMSMDSKYADGYVHIFGERPGVDLEKDVTAIAR